MTEDLVSLADVQTAADRIDRTVKRTPVDSSRTFADRSGARAVHFKLETLQRTGSFKIRGAANKLASLTDEELQRGVVAASGGNHAQGVALAARDRGADATIVMPEVTPMAKIDATRSYGAEVVIQGDIYQESYEHARTLAEKRGATFVHPFDDRAVIAGQGTIGLELAEAVPEIDTVVVAIGGGGLISGVATALKPLTDARVVGVQTEGCAHMRQSVERGAIQERDSIDTIAEGIAASRTEPYTFRHVSERVDTFVEVSDAMVTEAMALLAERAKLVTESAGAVAPAALLSDSLDLADETVAVPVCGANIDLTQFANYARDGLSRMGRYGAFRLAVPEWPSSVEHIDTVVTDSGAAIDEVSRETADPAVRPTDTSLTVTVEGSSPEHLARVGRALDEHSQIEVIARPST